MAENADDFVAGWVSGVAGLALTQPVDYVLTRMQSGGAHAADSATGFRGVLAMWRGFMPLAATVPVNNAMLMYGYGVGKSYAERDHANRGGTPGESSLAPIFLGGCVGGFVQSFLQAPVELIKVRIQLAAAGEAPATSALTLELLRGGGGGSSSSGGSAAAASAHAPSSTGVVPPLLRLGLTATLLRDVLPHGVWFYSYEVSKRYFEKREAAANPLASNGGGDAAPQLSTSAQLAAGSYAAIAAWVVGYPADLLKTRCQMVGGPKSLGEAARIVHAEGGIAAFYQGLTLKLLRAVPQSAAGFFVYEWTMKLLARRHGSAQAGGA